MALNNRCSTWLDEVFCRQTPKILCIYWIGWNCFRNCTKFRGCSVQKLGNVWVSRHVRRSVRFRLRFYVHFRRIVSLESLKGASIFNLLFVRLRNKAQFRNSKRCHNNAHVKFEKFKKVFKCSNQSLHLRMTSYQREVLAGVSGLSLLRKHGFNLRHWGTDQGSSSRYDSRRWSSL